MDMHNFRGESVWGEYYAAEDVPDDLLAASREIERLRALLVARPPRCGDTVKHRPTGETWEVAYCEGGRLSPAGWPECLADLADCEIVERCNEERHVAAVSRWLAGSGSNDSGSPCLRRAKVKTLYGHVVQPPTTNHQPPTTS